MEVGALAQEARFRAIPARQVTFVIDSNPNYTNVCITDCQFCAFYRKPGHPEAWTLTVEQVLEKIEFAASKGATTVLLQGGHNPELPLDYYLTIVRESRRRFPAVTPHFFTASEIQTMAEVSGLTHARRAGAAPGGGTGHACPAAARKCSRSACASASSPRRAAPAPGWTCTGRHIARASGPPPP